MSDPADISNSTTIPLSLVVSAFSFLFGIIGILLSAAGRAREKILVIGIETAKELAQDSLRRVHEATQAMLASERDRTRVHTEMMERIHDNEMAIAKAANSSQDLQEMRGKLVTREFLEQELKIQAGQQTADLLQKMEARRLSSAQVPAARSPYPTKPGPDGR